MEHAGIFIDYPYGGLREHNAAVQSVPSSISGPGIPMLVVAVRPRILLEIAGWHRLGTRTKIRPSVPVDHGQ